MKNQTSFAVRFKLESFLVLSADEHSANIQALKKSIVALKTMLKTIA